MLICARNIRELDFDALMEVYEEGNAENAACFFPDETPERQHLLALQGFRQYLENVFFNQTDAQYWILTDGGRYVSALRLEAHPDGLLLEALETRPDCRRQGFAAKLIQSVLPQLSPGIRVYSHVGKSNAASIATHLACGFHKHLDYVMDPDGTRYEKEITFVVTA